MHTDKLHTNYLATILILITSLAFISTGCDSTGSDGAMGTLNVEMTDAPIDSAAEVNVNIQRIEVQNSEGSGEWTTLAEPNKTYNLLDFTNGEVTVLGGKELPVGTYPQIRLILGDTGNSFTVYNDDGSTTTYDMKVPSGAQSGVKLNINATIEEGIEYTVLLDFDAGRSVKETGQGTPEPYILRPTIDAMQKAISGVIEGVVDPADALPVIYAVSNSDTTASTISDTTSGEFMLMGLSDGTYDVAMHSRNDNYQDTTLSNIDVFDGETTDVDTVEISEESIL
jgi:hypothetical protein